MKYKDKITTMLQDIKTQSDNIHRAVTNNTISKEELEKSLMAMTKKIEHVTDLVSLESYSY